LENLSQKTGLPKAVFSKKSSSVVYCKNCCGKKGLSNLFAKYSFKKEIQVLEFIRSVGFLSVHFIHQTSTYIFKPLYHLFTYYPKVKMTPGLFLSTSNVFFSQVLDKFGVKSCSEFTHCILPTLKHLCKQILPRCLAKKQILKSIDKAKHSNENLIMPVRDYISLPLAAASLFFKVDIVFTRFLYNQDAAITTHLDCLQNSSEKVHICAFENENDDWLFFPMVPPTLAASYFKNLVSIKLTVSDC
jgi:hypothetical protein